MALKKQRCRITIKAFMYTLTDIVLEAYRAVKLNWPCVTTASNPNAYVCKWDVMVPAWYTR